MRVAILKISLKSSMDIDIKELAKTVAENLNLKDFKGDIVGVKVVENEFGNIEPGGIGIQINHVKDVPLTVSEKDIKAVILELQNAKDEKGQYVFQNKKQWWAVYQVLLKYCHYPSQMTAFTKKMEELEVAKIDGKRDLSYDSLSGASKDVPKMATCLPETWDAYKDISDNYKQQYVVAEFLMLKLGIKS